MSMPCCGGAGRERECWFVERAFEDHPGRSAIAEDPDAAHVTRGGHVGGRTRVPGGSTIGRRPPGAAVADDELLVDANAFLPKRRNYYQYQGSLTTPPCSEGVRWNVLRTPLQASPEQIAALREALGASSRHVQPLGQRTVLLGS